MPEHFPYTVLGYVPTFYIFGSALTKSLFHFYILLITIYYAKKVETFETGGRLSSIQL